MSQKQSGKTWRQKYTNNFKLVGQNNEQMIDMSYETCLVRQV